MASLPITQGYTINIVKDRSESAVILLNSKAEGGTKTFYITVPDHHNKAFEEEVVSNHKNGDDEVTEIIVPETQYYIQQEDFTDYNNEEVVETEDEAVLQTDCDNKLENAVVSSHSEDHITEVAHEEVVEGEVVVEPGGETCVHCDLCNTRLESGETAKLHMRQTHHILTYDGPFFKCDFCGLFVTDRVSHMKVAHYSPLSQAFCKNKNLYSCLQCSYTSDQLTNIRNHVDAKHSIVDNKYVCEECNSEYKTLNSMRAHKSRVHVKKRRKLEDASRETKCLADRERTYSLQQEIQELEKKTFNNLSRTGVWM